MSIQKIAGAIAKKEGNKSQARIGDIREILRIMSEMEADALTSEESPLCLLMADVKKIQRKKAGKK